MGIHNNAIKNLKALFFLTYSVNVYVCIQEITLLDNTGTEVTFPGTIMLFSRPVWSASLKTMQSLTSPHPLCCIVFLLTSVHYFYLFWWMYCFLFFPKHVYHFSTVVELLRPWKGLRSSSILKSKIRGVKLKSSCTDDIQPILIYLFIFYFYDFQVPLYRFCWKALLAGQFAVYYDLATLKTWQHGEYLSP